MNHIMYWVCAALFVFTAALPACADDAPVQLIQGKSLAPDVASYPRIKNGGAAGDKINAALSRDEQKMLEKRNECKHNDVLNDPPDTNFEYDVSIKVTMKGPNFVSYVKEVEGYCPGNAHEDEHALALVFDISSGRMVNWFKLLPASLLPNASEEKADKTTSHGTITSSAITALYLAYYNGKNPDCPDLMKDMSFQFWPDAKQNGVAFWPDDLPHLFSGCKNAVTVPVEKLRELGGDKELLDAIESAHDHGWYDKNASN